MDRVASILQRVVPEVVHQVGRRYSVLRGVLHLQPVGRRVLAEHLRMSERLVRGELDFFRESGMVEVMCGGVSLTSEGYALIDELQCAVASLVGLSQLEAALAEKLGLEKAIIAVGNADADAGAKAEMARLAARHLREVLQNGDIIAVSGGSTMSEVVNALCPGTAKRSVTVIPARGGLGEDVEIQANTIAARMAKVLGGTYRLLHVQDGIGDETALAVSQEPVVREVLSELRQSRVVVHGIGLAEEMARRRGMPPDHLEQLRNLGAVGEAFGYYFDRAGNIVFQTSSIGLGLADLASIETVIAVGGGESKAMAVLSVIDSRYHDVLVTDEGTARVLIGQEIT